jgi:hypothetical protein
MGNARHVIDTHFEALFPEQNGILHGERYLPSSLPAMSSHA